MSMTPLRLDHAAYRCKDAKETTTFYTKLLGMRLVAGALAMDWVRAPEGETAIRELRATYYGMLAEVDAQVGRLLDALGPRVDLSGVTRARSYGTPVKTRILAGGVHSAKQQVVRIDRAWVPGGEGSLYLRPFMIANEVFLGVKPSAEYIFAVIASPVLPVAVIFPVLLRLMTDAPTVEMPTPADVIWP